MPGVLWETARILSARSTNNHDKSHEERVYNCESCSYTTDKLTFYEKHLSIHIGFVTQDCPNCGEEFTEVTDLNRHMCGYQSEDKSYGCEYCTKEFACPSGLKKHVRRHTGFLSFTCEKCDKKFKEKSELVRHMKTHKGKKYECDRCEKSFFEKKDLSRHVQSHSGSKPFNCPECGKQFGRKNDLVRHSRLHTGERHYNCEYCGKTFYRKDKLNIHIRIHTGEKPFPCEHCGRRFSAKTDMIRHFRSHDMLFSSALRASPSNLPLATELQIADS